MTAHPTIPAHATQEPDFAAHAARLQGHRLYPDSDDAAEDATDDDWHLDLDLDLEGPAAARH